MRLNIPQSRKHMTKDKAREESSRSKTKSMTATKSIIKKNRLLDISNIQRVQVANSKNCALPLGMKLTGIFK